MGIRVRRYHMRWARILSCLFYQYNFFTNYLSIFQSDHYDERNNIRKYAFHYSHDTYAIVNFLLIILGPDFSYRAALSLL